MTTQDRYFRSSSFPLVNFLFAKKMQIAGVDTVSGDRKEFVFVHTDRLDELVNAYKFADSASEDLLVSVKEYETTRRQLLELLKGN